MLREWRRLPGRWRERVHITLQAMAAATTPWHVRRVWRRGRPARPPVIVVGLFGSSRGLGQGARLFADALEGRGLDIARLDAGPALQLPSDLDQAGASPPGAASGGVLISHLNPPELGRWLQRTAATPLRGRRHIGYWAWELQRAPPAWRPAFGYVDEVWCPSEFTAAAVRAAAPARIPVRVVGHPMFASPPAVADRARFGLPPCGCMVLATADLKSTAARKNPLGAIEAFRRAVPAPGALAFLVCKLTGGARDGSGLAAIRTAAAGRPDIVLMHQELSGADMSALIATADIVVSLHRAEGFGLVPAEALWRGKAVVATAWSGVMDFLDDDSAALVRWTPAPVRDGQAIYEGGEWAEPDPAHAAGQLARLIDDPIARAELGRRARARALAVFDRERWFASVAEALGAGSGAPRVSRWR